MASFYEDTISRLTAQSDVIGRLAQDSGGFAAVMAAFEAKDADAFRWALDRLALLPECELICEWVRIKIAVLRSRVVCGPLREEGELPDLTRFAQAVVRLGTADDHMLHRLVSAVSCGNGEEYRAVIEQLRLTEFCHLIFYWVYSIIYVRVCEIVCNPRIVNLPDPVREIRAASTALGKVGRADLSAIARGATTLNCEVVRSVIDKANLGTGCEVICRLICVWRCAWVCRVLCRVPPPIFGGRLAIEEARAFALAARQLATQPRALSDLVTAVQNRDAKLYEEIISRFGLGPYCWQICGWVCSVSCFEFCICICPPPEQLLPVFTAIGAYQYETQIDSDVPATGLTFGDTRAFFSTLRLNGVLPQTFGGQPLEYQFQVQPVHAAATTLATAITSTGQTSVHVANGASFPPAGPFNVVIGSSNASGGVYEIMTVIGVSGNHWTVIRGQQGTAALGSVAIGAKIVTGTAANGAWTAVQPSQIARTVIGLWEHFVGGMNPIDTKVFTVNGLAGPNELVTTFTADGWIQVPQMNNVFSAAGAFFPNGNMIELDSTTLASFTASDQTGVITGHTAANLPSDLYFGIRMMVRQAGNPATEQPAGTCSVVAIDNTLYNNVSHHPDWAGYIGNGQLSVAMVDIAELQSDGCADLTESLTVLFTASHPNLGGVSLQLTGPGGPYGFTLPQPIPQTGDWFGTATPDGWAFSDLIPCAYIVTLSVAVLLTTGDGVPNPLPDQIAFCKSSNPPSP